jgi:hypothetical protein
MRDDNGDGREDYCRVLLWTDNTYQPVCAYSGDTGFDSRERVDTDPPDHIKTLLTFYDGCSIWFKLKNDILDTLQVSTASVAGNMVLDEKPGLQKTKGLVFNGINQFLRLSDSSDLSLGNLVPMRSLKTWMCWVYFDSFTNNAKIFDFGNGSGMDNVFLGIVGKGDTDPQLVEKENPCQAEQESTVPKKPSGAQPVEEMSPQDLMTLTEENANDDDPYYQIRTEYGKDSKVNKAAYTLVSSATLIYEVWDKQQRKMSIRAPNAITLNKWTHIAITTTGNNPFRPDIAIYIDGNFTLEKKAGWLPSTSKMSNCYLGKSNWTSTKYNNQDELFKGKLFDFRAYKKAVSVDMIQSTVAWGKEKLSV